MIEILDHPQELKPYFEVFHLGSNEAPEIITYNPNGLDGIDRDNALKQIINIHGADGYKIIN